MILYLVRHGETEGNAARIFMGRTERARLSEKGVRQAKGLSEKLKGEKFSWIYSSDLTRAVQTCEIIAKHHKAPIVFTADLQEHNFEFFEGKPIDFVEEIVRKSGAKNWLSLDVPGAETRDSLKSRARKFLKSLPKAGKSEKILVVAHSHIIIALIAEIKKMPLGDAGEIPVPNASLTEVEFNPR